MSTHKVRSNSRRRIPKGRGDVTVQVLRPDSELILNNAERTGEFALVKPVQVVIDLFCMEGPGKDGAMKLYQKMRQKIERHTQRPDPGEGVVRGARHLLHFRHFGRRSSWVAGLSTSTTPTTAP